MSFRTAVKAIKITSIASTQASEYKSNRISHLLLMQIKYVLPVLKGSLAISDKTGHAITLRASNYAFGFLPMELKMYVHLK